MAQQRGYSRFLAVRDRSVVCGLPADRQEDCDLTDADGHAAHRRDRFLLVLREEKPERAAHRREGEFGDSLRVVSRDSEADRDDS